MKYNAVRNKGKNEGHDIYFTQEDKYEESLKFITREMKNNITGSYFIPIWKFKLKLSILLDKMWINEISYKIACGIVNWEYHFGKIHCHSLIKLNVLISYDLEIPLLTKNQWKDLSDEIGCDVNKCGIW